MDKFYSILRKRHPTTTIIFIENPIFPQATYDTSMKNIINKKNEALHVEYNKIRLKDKHTLLLQSTNMIGLDNEATVDGIHFTDLGFMRYAEFLHPTLLKLLK